MQTTKFSLTLLSLLCYAAVMQAQLTTAPGGGNKKASVTEKIGITDVAIHYDRPGVKGREDKIWGQLVHEGFVDQGFGPSKSAPWRAGANENTTIAFTTDVKIEGQPVAAGKYALFVAYAPGESTVILSKNYNSLGSYFYDPKEDALRVQVKPVSTDKSQEWLMYEFSGQTENAATLNLAWEKKIIPIKIEVDYVKTQLESFRNELRTDKGFKWESWIQAAQFCLEHKTNLEEALKWSETAVSGVFVGEKNFQTLSAKAQVLAALNRGTEADIVMKEALPLGKMPEIHAYARQLLQQKRVKEALETFQMNYNKNPNQFTTNMGLARGFSANGNYKKALEYMQKALPQAPDSNNKNAIERMIKTLQEGKDIN
ncbi:MAG: DUF2911 domain-containing protein [Gemmatimonadaceae bacterium]|nr:DUF2911 domain-containing protein [Chitinophagaceae bacterium]